MASGDSGRGWRRRGFLRVALAALAAAAAARLLPRRGGGAGPGGGPEAAEAPPGCEARHWRKV